MDTKKKMIIVSGASGTLGKAYLEKLKDMPGIRSIGIVRPGSNKSSDAQDIVKADLMDEAGVASRIAEIDISGISEIIFIHPVGKFRFERNGKPHHDKDEDGIDDEIYRSNVDTFFNVVNPLLTKLGEEAARRNSISLRLCAFGSISDRYGVPYWQSYTKAKDVLRKSIQAMVDHQPNGLVRGFFVNLSSVDTENEQELRPYADRTYWLKCEQIAEQTLPSLLKQEVFWQEVDLFNPNPEFNPHYYQNLKELLEKWQHEMRSPGWKELRTH